MSGLKNIGKSFGKLTIREIRILFEKWRKINMLKEVTILTFDETEHLRNRLDSIIDGLKVGKEEKDSATYSCEWAIGQIKEIREMFD